MNFTEILREHRIEHRTEGNKHCRPGWVQLHCPFCDNNQKKFHMGYNLAGRYLNCWACGSKRVPETLVHMLGISLREAIILFTELPSERLREIKLKGTLKLPAKRVPLTEKHKDYLRNRRFDPDQLQEFWKIESIATAPRLAHRIFIPAEHAGMVVSWTTRSISNKTAAKYVSAGTDEEALSLKSILYGEDYCRHSIIVNEGPLDAWAIGPGAVATCGTSYTRAQVLRIVKYPVRVVCFDNEPTAQRRANRLVSDLSVFPGETYNVVLSAKDASRAPRKEIKELRKRFLEGTQ